MSVIDCDLPAPTEADTLSARAGIADREEGRRYGRSIREPGTRPANQGCQACALAGFGAGTDYQGNAAVDTGKLSGI